MSFDYSAAKAAIKKAGHTVSTGPHVLSTDIKEIVKFGRRTFGLSEVAVRKGIANPTLLPEGFPGVVAAPVAESAPEASPVEEAAPVAPETPTEATVTPESTPDAPSQKTESADDAPKVKKSKKDAESTPAETPTGEQAAQ